MRITHLLSGLILSTIFSSCALNKQIQADYSSGKASFQQEDYALALSQLEKVISMKEEKGKIIDLDTYSMAGISALRIGNNEKARTYLEKIAYNEKVDSRSIDALAEVYRNIDNLSKEMKTIELYLTKFPNGKELSQMQSRLFQTYIESENWEKGLSLWEKFSEIDKEKTTHLEGYLKIQQAMDNEELADQTAEKILSTEKENTIALEYLATKYYKRAEDLYQIEMEAYENNKTNKQYKILLQKLKIIGLDFKKSRDYFERLFNENSKAEYATYLGNIYARLNNKDKSEFYRNLAKGGQ
ncbi:MAG: hypothetical protein K9H64_01035 [Bacteroidales bacterium]|nr:hypothetical protein [Bacteroidales bacterium]MCF8454763.1 hypothetical protein [Bacteroidales bacterium]